MLNLGKSLGELPARDGEEGPMELWWLSLNSSACLWQFRATLLNYSLTKVYSSDFLAFWSSWKVTRQPPTPHVDTWSSMRVKSLPHNQTHSRTGFRHLPRYGLPLWVITQCTGFVNLMNTLATSPECFIHLIKISITKLSFLEYFKWEGPESKFRHHWQWKQIFQDLRWMKIFSYTLTNTQMSFYYTISWKCCNSKSSTNYKKLD